jgi:hypothetical protein
MFTRLNWLQNNPIRCHTLRCNDRTINFKFPNDVPKDFDTATLGWPFFLACTPT